MTSRDRINRRSCTPCARSVWRDRPCDDDYRTAIGHCERNARWIVRQSHYVSGRATTLGRRFITLNPTDHPDTKELRPYADGPSTSHGLEHLLRRKQKTVIHSARSHGGGSQPRTTRHSTLGVQYH